MGTRNDMNNKQKFLMITT